MSTNNRWELRKHCEETPHFALIRAKHKQIAESMERYRITSNSLNGSLSSPRRPTTTTIDHITLPPPRPHLHRNTPFQSYQTTAAIIRRGAATVDDKTELSIFGAERYFNDVVCTDVTKPVANEHHKIVIPASPRDSSVSSVDGYGRRGWRFYGTPTTSSEASWNSRSGLLTNPPGSVTVSVRAFPLNETNKLPVLTSRRRRFGWTCPCSGKKSVVVEEKYSEPKSTPARSMDSAKTSHKTVELVSNGIAGIKLAAPKELEGQLTITDDVMKLKIVAGSCNKEAETFNTSSCRSLPFNDVAGGLSLPILNPPVTEPSLDDPARDSLEVFRPTEDLRGLRRSAEFQRPAIANFGYTGSPIPRGGGGDDDVASDTSSDLFEIESFSTQCRRRDLLDELETRRNGGGALRLHRSSEEEGTAPSECCYPPSEVSVEWSVVTAEGFDRASVTNFNFSSAASEFDELRYAGEEHDRLAAATKKKAPTSGGGGLLTSCRCEKAVNVEPGPVRFEPKQRHPVAVAVATDHGRMPALVRPYTGRASQPPLLRRGEVEWPCKSS